MERALGDEEPAPWQNDRMRKGHGSIVAEATIELLIFMKINNRIVVCMFRGYWI
jgi:hypothetical protein